MHACALRRDGLSSCISTTYDASCRMQRRVSTPGWVLMIVLAVVLYARILRLVRMFFFFQAEDGIRDIGVTGVQTCALPICVFTEAERAYCESRGIMLGGDYAARFTIGALGFSEHALSEPRRALDGFTHAANLDRKSVV